VELTIDQALQKGIEAHKAGQIQEADKFYTAILQSQPKHPDANHNLGVLAASANKVGAALLLFKTALEANPKIEQFWLSYIDALIKEKQFDNAKQVLDQAKRQGVAREKLNVLETQLPLTAQVNEPKSSAHKKSLEFSEKRKKLTEQKKQKKAKKIKATSPSEVEVNNLLHQFQTARYGDAEKLALSLTERFPHHNFSWKVLAEIFKKVGRTPKALVAGQKAVEIDSQDPAAHFNLGITLQELGRLDEAEASYTQAIALRPGYAEAHGNLGVTLKELGRLNEADVCYEQAIKLKPDYAEAHSNLGVTLQELGRLEEAEISLRRAIALKPDHAEAHGNLGVTLQELGRLEEAKISYTQAIVLQPDYAEAYSNLGNTLQELGRLEEAEVSLRQAIALKPDLAEVHNNLGNALQELGRLDKAKISYTQAIVLKPDYAEAHSNLGNTLQELGRLKEAEASYTQAIALKPDFALAHYGLGKVLYIKGNEDLALKSIVKANDIEPQSKDYELMLSVLEVRKSRKSNESVINDTSKLSALRGLISSPLILNRVVEPELIASLYGSNSIQLDKTKRVGLLASGKTDARYGNGIVSPDFNLFGDSRSIIQKVAKDLTKIMMEALKSEIYVYDSFFNILRAGGGLTPHNHLINLDKNIALDLGKQKYSLVYYLSVGDQNCREPGILKFYEPGEDILPCEGMIAIFSASRMHSSIYGGKKDRIMIGVNFYSL